MALSGCSTSPSAAPAPNQQSAGTARPVPVSTDEPRQPYLELADSVVAHGAQAWVEADLVKAWLEGPDRYRHVLDIVVAFASRPGIAGVKIADELGYGDGLDAAKALAFLKQTTAALHARLPGRRVLADIVVPEFGCLDWQHGSDAPSTSPPSTSPPSTSASGATAGAATTPSSTASVVASQRTCAQVQRAKYPGATLAAVDAEIAHGGLDVVDLSAGLREDGQYVAWGTTRDVAMAAIWDEASRRWSGEVTLQARKALAHPGRYTGSAQTAERDVHTFVDIPLAHGAKAVDIWTWSQPYKGGTYQLTDPGITDNPLIAALRSRRAKGAHLWTHMSPSSLQRGVGPDVTAATAIFDAVLVASGTG